MKPSENKRYSDEEIERALGGRFRDTTPQFEARWVALRRELRQGGARRRSIWGTWTVWMGAAAAGAALALAVVAVRRPVATEPQSGSPAVEVTPELAELFAMDAVLSRARVLLDDEQRAALMHLNVKSTPET